MRISATALVTNVLRDNYVGQVNSSLNLNTNAFRRDAVVAALETNCDLIDYKGPVSGFPNTTLAFNLTESPRLAVLYLYDAQADVISPNQLGITSLYGQPECLTAGQCQPLLDTAPVTGTVAACRTAITLSIKTIIYTVWSDNFRVIGFRSNDTTVDIGLFAAQLIEYAAAPEGAAAYGQNTVESGYDSGYESVINDFSVGTSIVDYPNVLHARFCAAASLTLHALWASYGMENPVNFTDPVYTVTGQNVQLHNLVIQTYVPTRSMALIAGSLLGFTLLVCSLGMWYAHLSPINLKDASDASILPNVDDGIIKQKRHAMGASNDPRVQCRLAFEPGAVLFCREAESPISPPVNPVTSSPVAGLPPHSKGLGGAPAFQTVTAKRIAIVYGTATQPPPGSLPDSRYDYV